jgi:hypothetical protein
MVSSTLFVSAAFSLVEAAIFFVVAGVLSRRRVSTDTRPAHLAFMAWWIGIGVTSVVTGALVLLYAGNDLSLWVYATMEQANVLVLTIALFGLMFYLAFLYAGSTRFTPYILLYYAAFYVGLEALINWSPPTGIQDNGWSLVATMSKAAPALPPWVIATFVVTLLVPQVLGAAAYALLYRRAEDSTQRFRIALVSASIVLWFGAPLLAYASGQVGIASNIVSQVIAIAASLTILLAYAPPRWMRARWNLRSVLVDAS